MARTHADVPVSDRCRAVNDILARIGDKGRVLIVMPLGDGTFRFNKRSGGRAGFRSAC